jgi:hypothetical protein
MIIYNIDRRLRDWRGLADLVRLEAHERDRVEASKDHAGEIISLW